MEDGRKQAKIQIVVAGPEYADTLILAVHPWPATGEGSIDTT